MMCAAASCEIGDDCLLVVHSAVVLVKISTGNGAYLHQEDQQVSLPTARGWSRVGFGVPSSPSHLGSL